MAIGAVSSEHQDNTGIHYQPFLESVSEDFLTDIRQMAPEGSTCR
jgi:hypothetical protein